MVEKSQPTFFCVCFCLLSSGLYMDPPAFVYTNIRSRCTAGVGLELYMTVTGFWLVLMNFKEYVSERTGQFLTHTHTHTHIYIYIYIYIYIHTNTYILSDFLLRYLVDTICTHISRKRINKFKFNLSSYIQFYFHI
jgi:hypothetical protein